jgi:predicted secreted protein
MGNAVHAFGTALGRNGNTVAELTKVGGISLDVDMTDVTSHQSTGGYEEVLPGIIRTGEVAIEGNLYPGDTNGQQGLLADLIAKTLQAFTITFPASTGTVWTFNAYVKKFMTGDADTNDKIPFSASLKISGAPSLGVTLSTGLTTPFLSADSGDFIPATSGTATELTLAVLTGATTVVLTPTAAAGVITIEVIKRAGVAVTGESQVVASGAAASAITLGAADTNTVVKISVKETNKSAKVYTLTIARP